jgi:hypothetical protein
MDVSERLVRLIRRRLLLPVFETQAGAPKPAYWPSDETNWPWPVGMWDKRQ